MSYKVLATKWRPNNFAAIVGQQAVVQVLQYSLQQQRLHHSYLFTGTRGVGKTTLARILAKCCNCEAGIVSEPCNQCDSCRAIDQGNSIDVLEVDGASKNKVEETRALLDNVQYIPVKSRFKIYIIDEVHMLSGHSFNALLKTIEEPPEHVKFFLATTDLHKVPATIISRCMQFQLQSLQLDEIILQLQNIMSYEQITYENAALQQIAIAAKGSLRDALSISESAIAFSKKNITLAAVLQLLGLVDQQGIIQLLSYIIVADAKSALFYLDKMSKSAAINYAKILAELQQLIYCLALMKIDINLVPSNYQGLEQLHQLINHVTAEELQVLYQISILGIRDLPFIGDPRSGLEMIILRMALFQPLITNNNLIPPVHGQPIRETERLQPLQNMQEKKPEVKPELQPVTLDTKVHNYSWESVLQQLQVSGFTKLLVRHSTLVQWQDNYIKLVLDPKQKALFSDRNISKLNVELNKLLQSKIQLEVIIGTENLENSPANKLQQSVMQDPNIKQLQQSLSATIENIVPNEECLYEYE